LNLIKYATKIKNKLKFKIKVIRKRIFRLREVLCKRKCNILHIRALDIRFSTNIIPFSAAALIKIIFTFAGYAFPREIPPQNKEGPDDIAAVMFACLAMCSLARLCIQDQLHYHLSSSLSHNTIPIYFPSLRPMPAHKLCFVVVRGRSRSRIVWGDKRYPRNGRLAAGNFLAGRK